VKSILLSIVSRDGGAAFALMRVPIEGGKPVRLEQNAWLPAVSPDGKWIAYSSQYTPPWNLVVIPSKAGRPSKFSRTAVARSNGQLTAWR
jgi:hypothetical protein